MTDDLILLSFSKTTPPKIRNQLICKFKICFYLHVFNISKFHPRVAVDVGSNVQWTGEREILRENDY